MKTSPILSLRMSLSTSKDAAKIHHFLIYATTPKHVVGETPNDDYE